MPSQMKSQIAQRADGPATQDVLCGVLVILVFLVPALLAGMYISHMSQMFAEWAQTLVRPAMLQGAGLC